MFYYRRNRKQREKFEKLLPKNRKPGIYLSSIHFVNDKDEIMDACYFERIENNSNIVRDSFLCILGTKEFCNLYKYIGYNIKLFHNTSCEQTGLKYKFDMIAGDYVYRDIDTGEVIISEKNFS